MSGKPDPRLFIDHLNSKTGRHYKATPANLKFLKARLSEGHSADDIYRVIDNKVLEWTGDPKMEPYLRPATLFNAEKFNQYVGEQLRESDEQRREREMAAWLGDSEVVSEQ